MRWVALWLAGLTGSALAEDASDPFVEANLISIFYHEMGHALIDIMDLPVFGQEEDAADTASILFIDALMDEETASAIAYDAAFGFELEAEQSSDPIAWWSTHGPDQQRFYNLVCLFYGANPETRDYFADDMDLPEERRDSCPDEFDLANDSWGPVLDEISDGSYAKRTIVEGDETSFTAKVIRSEVQELNTFMALPETLTVRIEPCGEPNAFYDLDERAIIMCTEFEEYLREIGP